MTKAVVFTKECENNFVYLVEGLTAKDVSVSFCSYFSDLIELVSTDPELVFVFFGYDVDGADIFAFLAYAKEEKYKGFPVCILDESIEFKQISDLAQHMNHFLVNIEDELVVKKKISHLMSLMRIKYHKKRRKGEELDL